MTTPLADYKASQKAKRQAWLANRIAQETFLMANGLSLREIIKLGKDAIAAKVAEIKAKGGK